MYKVYKLNNNILELYCKFTSKQKAIEFCKIQKEKTKSIYFVEDEKSEYFKKF